MRNVFFSVLVVMFVTTLGSAQTYIAGNTFCSEQHFGSCGRMIGVDSSGCAHVVWMKQHYPDIVIGGPLDVRYNVWNPDSGTFNSPAGYVVAPGRSGFACLALDSTGWCYPAFHGLHSMYYTIFAGIDFYPLAGLFSCFPPLNLYEPEQLETYHPRKARDVNGKLHVLSVAFLSSTNDSCRLLYSRGTPRFNEFGEGDSIHWDLFGQIGYDFVDTSQGLLHDIAASQTTPTIARAWAKTNGHVVDLWLQRSTDGGSNWLAPVNVTQFIPPDSNCFTATGNAHCCSRDTLRLKCDLSLLFDNSDHLHIAFTTVAYYHFPAAEDSAREQPTKAIIWHWSDLTNLFSVIASQWVESEFLSTSAPLLPDHAIVERPGLALDRSTGEIYCSYIRYDTSAWYIDGTLNGDVFVSVSADNGENWVEGTNVTFTRPPIVPAPTGLNQSEQDATLAEYISANQLHIFYCLDLGYSYDEYPPHPANRMIYQRIPVGSIAHTPFAAFRVFHAEIVDCDTNAHVEPDVPLAKEFRLEPPYPNPFNSRTVITFAVSTRMSVNVKVYDVLGREVQTILNGMRDTGEHSLSWTPAGLGSGLYFVRMKTDFGSRLQKVVYLR